MEEKNVMLEVLSQVFSNVATPFIFVIIVGTLVYIVYKITSLTSYIDMMDNNHMNDNDELGLESRIEELLREIESLNKERNVLNGEMTKPQIKAWESYTKNGIQLPVDIMEEIMYHNPQTFDETVDFIENKRHIWKQEMSKKLYRGGK